MNILAGSGVSGINRPGGYITKLMRRLAAELRDLEPKRAAKHRDFLCGCQREDGGFSGRADCSDLYYTSFAVRALSVLGELTRPVCDTVAGYLKRRHAHRREQPRPATLIDHVTWLYTASTIALASGGDVLDRFGGQLSELPATFESFRAADGGYARTHAAASGSTYCTFLVVAAYELIGQQPPHADAITDFALSRRREDGGFVEIGPMRRSGTNPTAAAATLLLRYGRIDADVRAGIRHYLTETRDPRGGFRANSRVPVADLLSTFTAIVTAEELEFDDVVDREATTRLVNSLERADGGYIGAVCDDTVDPEYTFYGLGSLGLLRSRGSRR